MATSDGNQPDHRPGLGDELWTQVFETAEEIESRDPTENRSFKDALEIVVEHADDSLNTTELGEFAGDSGSGDNGDGPTFGVGNAAGGQGSSRRRF